MRQTLGLIFFIFHFWLLIAAALQSTVAAARLGHTSFGSTLSRWLPRVEQFAASSRAANRAEDSLPAQFLLLYQHGAGIDTGYGFFAPNVPSNRKLLFEFRYPDGSKQIVLPTVRGKAASVRLVDLLDRLSQVEYPPLRELIVRMLAEQARCDHATATAAHAVFLAVSLPTPEQYFRGEEETYFPLFDFDFDFHGPPPSP